MNRLQKIWAEGKAASNCWLSIPASIAAEQIAHQGWHSVTIDMQHGYIDYASMLHMLTAIQTTDCVPLLRVPWNNPGDVMRALDAGVEGVICPNVDTRAQCEAFVDAARYAPLGNRSVGPRRAAMVHGADYLAKANESVLAIVQIESALALKNVDEIATVKGLDMLFVGPSDLGLSLGRGAPADPTDPVTVAALDAILASAKRHDLRAGIYTRTVSYAKQMVAKGFDLVTVMSDEVLLASGAALAKEFL